VAPTGDFVPEPIWQEDLEDAMSSQARLTRPFPRGGDFTFVRRLQPASRNNGYVDEARLGGRAVAVKKMPDWWMCSSSEEFDQNHPGESERPWTDLGLLSELQRRRYPYSCDFLGIFHRGAVRGVVTGLATGGNLLDWSDSQPEPGPSREGQLLPLVVQMCHAVQLLHHLGVAHRDLSPENILLTECPAGLRVKLIDFSMASLGQFASLGHRVGKTPFIAPEQFAEGGGDYDAFLADVFSLGVVICSMASADYPWSATAPGDFPLEDPWRAGTRALLERVQPADWRQPLSQVVSPALMDLLCVVLEPDPRWRASLGEPCYRHDSRASAWRSRWLGDASPTAAPATPGCKLRALGPKTSLRSVSTSTGSACETAPSVES